MSEAILLFKSIKEQFQVDPHLCQENMKWDIVNFHYENNTYYRNKIQVIPSGFSDLPIIQKKDLQSDSKELLSKGYHKKNVYQGSTSGSSGHPFTFAKDKLNHALTYVLIEDRYNSIGISLNSSQARFFGIPLSGKSRWSELLKDYFFNRYRFTVYDLSESAFEEYVKIFKKKKFDYVYGYTSSIVQFSRYLMDSGILLKNLCPTLKRCVVTSEVCTIEDEAIIRQGIGVEVTNEYGASEVDLIGFGTASEFLVSEENIFLEVVDEYNQPLPHGKVGKILVTSLHNKAYPMIRYEIGDMGSIKIKDGRKILNRLEGRTNDLIILPSGKKAAGLTFYYISRSILESGGGLKEFIVRQTAPNKFEFDVVSNSIVNSSAKQHIQNCLDTYLEPGLLFKINQCKNIERPISGKIKHFYSEIG